MVLAATLSLLSFATHSAARDYRLQPVEIAPDVYILLGKTEHFSFKNGGNIVNTGFIVGDNGVIVIDSGPSKLYGEQMREVIRRVTDKPVEMVLISHFHPDHFLGSQGFPNTRIVAMADTVAGIRTQGELFNDAMYRLVGPWMKGTEVIVPETLEYQRFITVAGRKLELIEYSGHSGSDLAIFDHQSGVLFAADLVFYQRAATTPHADVEQWLADLDKLSAIPYRVLIPGHGPVVHDDSAIRQTRDYLQWLQASLEQQAEKGRSMAEVLQALDPPGDIAGLAVFAQEYQRSVAHLYPRIEQQAIARGKVKQIEP